MILVILLLLFFMAIPAFFILFVVIGLTQNTTKSRARRIAKQTIAQDLAAKRIAEYRRTHEQ